MENSILMQRDLDDILFEHRNRAYGAYALRKSYGKHVKRGSYFGAATFLIFIFSPLIASKLKSNDGKFDNVKVVMIEPPALENEKKYIPPPPPPPPPPARPIIATTIFLPPKVTNQEDINDEIIKNDDIKTAVSDKTRDGVVGELPPVADVPPPPVEPVEEKKTDKDDDDKVVPIFGVQQQPEFMDGQAAMYKFLGENIKYPVVARENGIEGTVILGFTVGKDGSIRDIQVKRGVAGGCSEEAVRIIRLMPNWRPGKQNGKPVNVAFTMPVKFKLD